MLNELEGPAGRDTQTVKETARAAKGAPATDASVPGATQTLDAGENLTIAPKTKPSRLRRVGRYLRDNPKFTIGALMVLAVVAFAFLGPFFTQDPKNSDNPSYASPSMDHLLGTTKLGHDMLAQLAHGARGSLLVGLLAGVVAVVLSVFFGVVAGYVSGWTDEILSLFTSVMLVIPGLPLAIVLSAYLPGRSLWLVALVLAVTGWAGSAIVLRSQARSLRTRDYVYAAKVAGEGPLRIITVEILPNLLPLVAAQFLFGVIFAILGEAGLSYLGLGPSGSITWGTILNQAQSGGALTMKAWWWFAPPGILIAIVGGGLSLINFSIDEIINPKLRYAPEAAKRTRKAKAELAARADDEVKA